MEPLTAVLKIDTLESGWHDVDSVMLHACFQCLVDYVENEEPFEIIDWSETKEVKEKIIELYDWWKSYDDHKAMMEHGVYEYTKIETEKLIELIKIRGYLWT